MQKWIQRILFLSFILFSVYSFAKGLDSKLTPGVLCTEDDPNFDAYYYDAHVARCNRNVNKSEKTKVAKEYGGIPESEWHNYEFDHLYPLCAGGSNDIENIWPEPIDDAHDKDKIENSVCAALRAGTMTQEEAIGKIDDWISEQ